MQRSPSLIDKQVGARVRMRRIMLGMSQETLAEAVGVTFQQVQKYEKGTNRIGAGRLQQLSKALRINLAYFYETETAAVEAGQSGFAEAAASDFSTPHLATAESVRLIKAFASIEDAKIRRRILELVLALAPPAAKDGPVGDND